MGVTVGVIGAVTAIASVGEGMDQARRARHTASDVANQETSAIDSALAANPTPVMPTPDDSAVQAANQAAIAEQVARRGRASTILTGPTADKLGA